MKVVKKINEEIFVTKETNVETGITRIILHVDGEKIVMFTGKTDDNYWADIRTNENYIVAYSRGNMASGGPLRVHCAYNIKYKRFVHMDKAMRSKIENMLITRKSIDLRTLLAIINGFPVSKKVQEDVDREINYLTGGNQGFTKEQVIQYILSSYPQLEPYSHYSLPISVYDYDQIEESLNGNAFFFHVMPQIIDLDEADQIASLPKKEQMRVIGKHPSL